MKGLAIFAFFLYLGCSVRGASFPDSSSVDLCDALSSKYGCDPTKWYKNDRLNCTVKGQIMYWASKAVKSDCYAIIAGTEDAPVTSYVPDELINIQVRVDCYGLTYRGILMYAVVEGENKVGDWEIPEGGDDANFRTPWSEGSCKGSLMHSTAELKPYISNIYYRAPPAGTGTITFRVLIKQGDANNGAFFWPSKDVVLTEGKAATTNSFIKLGEAGQSCDEVCKTKEGYACDVAVFDNLKDYEKEAVKQTACALPFLSGCGQKAGTFDSNNHDCYYPSLTCAETNRTPISTNCFTQIPGVQRFCACSTKASVTASASTTASTDGVNVGTEMSSANSVRGFSALMVLAMFFVSPRTATVFLVFLGLSSAHNWVNSQSRSRSASLYRPFKPATSDMPHLQVGPNQLFQIEWMNAHGGFTYFAIWNEKYAVNATSLGTTIMEDYLKNAPDSGKIDATKGIWQKFHRKPGNSTDNYHDRTETVVDFFQRVVPPTDPIFVSRNPLLRGRVGSVSKPNDTNTNLMQFKIGNLTDDRRASYKSAKYPWLEYVAKFKHSALQAAEPDVANFLIPGFAGVGRYVVQYFWGAYRDAIDVDYVAKNVTNVYGTTPDGVRWKRIDHCLFQGVKEVFDFSEIVTDVNYCLKRCAEIYSCGGVNVVPLMAPSSAHKFDKPANGTKWRFPKIYGTDIYVPWNQSIFYNNTEVEAMIAKASPKQYMCYTINPRDPSDTADEYTITKDSADPIFYSTCYYPYKGNLFPGYPEGSSIPSVDKGRWKFYDKCISCSDQSINDHPVFPVWNISDVCVDCDQEPKLEPQPKGAPEPINAIESGVQCDGLNNKWRVASHNNCTNNETCVIKLMPIGRKTGGGNGRYADVYPAECRAMVEANKDCSNQYFWSNRSTQYVPAACYCYAKTSCCNSCSRKNDGFSTIYEIKKTAADPDCSNGIKDADGKYCCSKTCGAGNCKAGTTDTNKSVGFCITNNISRSCSEYGAPCVL